MWCICSPLSLANNPNKFWVRTSSQTDCLLQRTRALPSRTVSESWAGAPNGRLPHWCSPGLLPAHTPVRRPRLEPCAGSQQLPPCKGRKACCSILPSRLPEALPSSAPMAAVCQDSLYELNYHLLEERFGEELGFVCLEDVICCFLHSRRSWQQYCFVSGYFSAHSKEWNHTYYLIKETKHTNELIFLSCTLLAYHLRRCTFKNKNPILFPLEKVHRVIPLTALRLPWRVKPNLLLSVRPDVEYS